MISTELNQQVSDRIQQCFHLATQRFQKPLRIVETFDWNLSGTTAGMAYAKRWRISFQPHIAVDNQEVFFSDTIPHECAHLIAWDVFGFKIEPHGEQWRKVMNELGVANPKRTHDYDVVEFKREPQQTVPYKCPCGKTYNLSTKRHSKVVRGQSHYLCTCKQRLVADASVITNNMATPLVIKWGSKQAAADYVFRKLLGQKSSVVIEAIKQHVGMSHAGATTYYYSFKKKYK